MLFYSPPETTRHLITDQEYSGIRIRKVKEFMGKYSSANRHPRTSDDYFCAVSGVNSLRFHRISDDFQSGKIKYIISSRYDTSHFFIEIFRMNAIYGCHFYGQRRV